MNPCFNEYLQNQNVIDKDVNTIGSCLLDSNTAKVCYKNFTDNISKLSTDTDFSNVIQRYKSCIIANNSPTPTPPSETSSSNIGMIVGIIFGVLILIILLIFLSIQFSICKIKDTTFDEYSDSTRNFILGVRSSFCI